MRSIVPYLIPVILLVTVVAYVMQPLKKASVTSPVTYVLDSNWPRPPEGATLGNPTGIGIDTSQHIVVFHRAGRTWPWTGRMPADVIHSNTIWVLDRDSGHILEAWGSGLFIMPHGLKVDHANNVWVTDVGSHQVFKFSHEGKLLMTLGEARTAGNDALHFNKPTDVAVAHDGSFYVADGYGNSRVIKFSAAGKYLFEWGRKGAGQGAFNIPHAISLDAHNNVYVADRENNRVQVFDSAGQFVAQYSSDKLGQVCAVAYCNNRLFVADDVSFLRVLHRGSDILVLDSALRTTARFGRSGSYAGPPRWYHALAVDKDANIYVGDIKGNTIQKFRKLP